MGHAMVVCAAVATRAPTASAVPAESAVLTGCNGSAGAVCPKRSTTARHTSARAMLRRKAAAKIAARLYGPCIGSRSLQVSAIPLNGERKRAIQLVLRLIPEQRLRFVHPWHADINVAESVMREDNPRSRAR